MFRVAEKVGGTVEELRERMDAEELLHWACYFEIKAERQEKAIAEAKGGAKKGSDPEKRTMGSRRR